MIEGSVLRKLFWTIVFGASFAFVESSVVTYLRALYYPEGFNLPLKTLPGRMLIVELLREAATIVMLLAVAAVAGRKGWQRFGYFILGFGVWGLFYYFWLWAILGWPSSLFEWDILFLIPVPWIGPVVAPALVALGMAVAGVVIVLRVGSGLHFRPGLLSWVSAIAGTVVLLYSFMGDTRATMQGHLPHAYRFDLLIASCLLLATSFIIACRNPSARR